MPTLFSVELPQHQLNQALLQSNSVYILDCHSDVFVWWVLTLYLCWIFFGKTKLKTFYVLNCFWRELKIDVMDFNINSRFWNIAGFLNHPFSETRTCLPCLTIGAKDLAMQGARKLESFASPGHQYIWYWFSFCESEGFQLWPVTMVYKYDDEETRLRLFFISAGLVANLPVW